MCIIWGVIPKISVLKSFFIDWLNSPEGIREGSSNWRVKVWLSEFCDSTGEEELVEQWESQYLTLRDLVTYFLGLY